MNNITYIWAIISLLTSCGGANESRGGYYLMGIWQQNPVIANGNDEEWEKPLKYINADEKLSYSITNDEVNLYVLLKTSSDQLQSKILRSALTIWVNTTGEKRAAAAVQLLPGGGIFPMVQQTSQFDKWQTKKRALGNFDTCRLSGFGNGIDKSYTIKSTNPAGNTNRY